MFLKTNTPKYSQVVWRKTDKKRKKGVVRDANGTVMCGVDWGEGIKKECIDDLVLTQMFDRSRSGKCRKPLQYMRGKKMEPEFDDEEEEVNTTEEE